MSRGRARFWTWYRTVPIAVMGVLLAVCLVFGALPTQVIRSVLCPVSYQEQILDSSSRHGVDPYLVCAMIECESSWDAGSVSDAGAEGLMQLMPSTAQELADRGLVDSSVYDPSNLTDPATNIEYGCAYLSYLSDNLENEDEVIAAYNAGMGTVAGWASSGYTDLQDVIEYPETSAYLAHVKSAEADYRTYYPDGIAE